MNYEIIKEMPIVRRGRKLSPELDAIAEAIKDGKHIKLDATTTSRGSLVAGLKARGVIVSTAIIDKDLYVTKRA